MQERYREHLLVCRAFRALLVRRAALVRPARPSGLALPAALEAGGQVKVQVVVAKVSGGISGAQVSGSLGG